MLAQMVDISSVSLNEPAFAFLEPSTIVDSGDCCLLEVHCRSPSQVLTLLMVDGASLELSSRGELEGAGGKGQCQWPCLPRTKCWAPLAFTSRELCLTSQARMSTETRLCMYLYG